MRLAGTALFLSAAMLFSGCATARRDDPFDGSSQLVVVTTADWDETAGTLTRYERQGGAWTPVGSSFDVVVGRTGLAWGDGLPFPPRTAGPVKKEGDGKSPAGLFRLTDVFGYDGTAPSTRMPYVSATPTLECVDDVSSPHYNTLVDTTRVAKTWSSSEMMRRQDELYHEGVVVAHNSDPVVAGHGSCIFLHIWSGPGTTTAGCTAMTAEHLAELIRWLDASKHPLLLQLPLEQLSDLSSQLSAAGLASGRG